jgi:hypothetical protein
MYALRERRQHVTQEDFLLAVSKVLKKNADANVRRFALVFHYRQLSLRADQRQQALFLRAAFIVH